MELVLKEQLKVKAIRAVDTYAVRHPVLRAGKPIDTCAFAGDDLDTTFHLGCFYEDELIGVASFLENDHAEHHLINAGQLRGMAVLQTHQGKGIGKILLTFGEAQLRTKHKSVVWMNAREVAVPFYTKLGYAIIGNVFDVPGIGPHYVMHKTIG
ncbi:GNAT family N-acetyltransferase [Arenibacter sp. GZD96]|uniref:GNAT family N-acetyltransferase n=1 Tax=Aurantibrevibacter litoralis TaxID=3106030 RepID=UPI002AFE9AFB|nr:GNAT family N-acetyltransferase [Arenibacter sp. GZD-96]MEA1786699.1 GNAT family N-acetyltransferase [Arenibacter sp. GZD-96]